MIFVFGSNLRGLHGAGAARFARERRGARMGVASGFASDRSYAIPTKDETIQNTLSLIEIKIYVSLFKIKAEELPETEFQVTRIGCGLAGLKDEDIAPMFIGSPKNCQFDEAWRPWLGDEYKYWGHFK